uniref:EGF-like domain-containing protein n=1 Tax=Timema bartmani TaxID=61472 RepID=A0A7R9F4V0_9NEOP|nr:unnamed protein product [Timema bartmani]
MKGVWRGEGSMVGKEKRESGREERRKGGVGTTPESRYRLTGCYQGKRLDVTVLVKFDTEYEKSLLVQSSEASLALVTIQETRDVTRQRLRGTEECKQNVDVIAEECSADRCSKVPCQHGGKCLTSGDSSAVCLCLLGYTGDLCETKVDLQEKPPQFTETRTSISPSSVVELNTTSALANYATEAGSKV